ncbi:MAG: efflux RND transporter permease subunit, partial [Parvibaculum sp.]
PIEYVIQASGTYEELDGYVQAMLNEIRANPGFTNPDTNLKLQKPQLDISVNREKVVDAGIDVATVGRTLETLLGGRRITRYEQGGKQYDVIVQVAEEERRTPTDISNIYVRGGKGEMVQLSNLVTVEEVVAPNSLNRFNQLRAATISAGLVPGYSTGEALAFLDETAARILPPVAQTDVDGQLREFVKSSGTIMVTFVLALIFIYLVLSAQFESFIDPLVILISVPLSIAGALMLLFLTNTSLNIYSQVGLITLVGLISKHGILIVEFSNQLREKGLSVYDAVIEAASLRLRPILMTTGAMALGAVPLALASGAGAESRRSIGYVIVGGITFGTLLTLFVVPTVYLLIASWRERRLAAKAAASHLPAE